MPTASLRATFVSLLLVPLACSGETGAESGGSSDDGSGGSMTGAELSTSVDPDDTGPGPETGVGTAGGSGDDTGGEAVCGNGVVDAGEACDDAGPSETCDMDCTAAVCGDGRLNELAGELCDGGVETVTCNDDCTFTTCGDGLVNGTAGERCDDGNEVDFDFCSNTCAVAPEVLLENTQIFDTDTGELDGEPQVSWDPATHTWTLTGLVIAPLGRLRVIGGPALRILVAGEVVVEGEIEAIGAAGEPPGGMMCSTAGAGGRGGPGGFAGGAGAGNGGSGTENGEFGGGPVFARAGGGRASMVNDGDYGGAGGGGGGHAAAGQPGLGSGGGQGGVGGLVIPSLPPLVGGGGGGGGSVEKDANIGMGLAPSDDEGGGGGGGGGAVAIEATVAITITGTIDVSGGAGGGDAGCTENPGYGGGGAGGSILLQSPATDVAGGTLDASGGLGAVPTFSPAQAAGMAGGNGADGRVVVM